MRLLRTATEPLRARGDCDFGSSDLATQISETVLRRLNEKYGRIPPPDGLFLHRKLGGGYLLLRPLRARIPVRPLLLPALDAAVHE
ncbi:MAG: hypothetical protein ACFCUG_12405 [Thiotrichales bacterium]